jgi:hypothetical protein
MLGIPIGAGLLYPFLRLVVSPELAGFLMAISSISVTLNTLLLKRFVPSFARRQAGQTRLDDRSGPAMGANMAEVKV